ncbi:hypothetical protein ARMGADRAFT_1061062 [Armillaria gallica]|uniref:Uncharacterized protein n=1 Tax=Armillaria gallica TaxID=47427 RepID=A0A2H3DM90_ARMGA|nr:hypothetical protein ARMGADRAFT_1061062 [Armillaria gallica]
MTWNHCHCHPTYLQRYMSSSLTSIPSRGQCIRATDYAPECQCVWYTEPTSPLLNQFICAACGHGIHSHVDYVSTTVCHNVATHCAAFVQKDPFHFLDSIGVRSDGSDFGANNAPYIPSTSGYGTLGLLDDATEITLSQTDLSSPSTSQLTQTTQSSDHHEFLFRYYVPRR